MLVLWRVAQGSALAGTTEQGQAPGTQLTSLRFGSSRRTDDMEETDVDTSGVRMKPSAMTFTSARAV
jgi:hypothetical protein